MLLLYLFITRMTKESETLPSIFLNNFNNDNACAQITIIFLVGENLLFLVIKCLVNEMLDRNAH